MLDDGESDLVEGLVEATSVFLHAKNRLLEPTIELRRNHARRERDSNTAHIQCVHELLPSILGSWSRSTQIGRDCKLRTLETGRVGQRPSPGTGSTRPDRAVTARSVTTSTVS